MYQDLLHPGALPGHRGVAAVALTPVLAEMHVILGMTRETILFQLHLIRGAPVAGLAGELAVCAGQSESSLFAVVELPQAPAVRGVAAPAVLAEIAFVHIVLAVAVDALLADLAIRACQVALFARHGDVQPDQREAGEVVVEGDVRALALGRVALIAAGTE